MGIAIETIGIFVIGLYTAALFHIAIFCLMQVHLLWLYLTNATTEAPSVLDYSASEDYPFVTIQLPVYNEKFVIERLLLCIDQIEYPADRLEVQILDDSTDETTSIIQQVLANRTADDIGWHHIRRIDRKGYKAGALQYGLQSARGAFIAIFDADFLPTADFLLRTIPYFKNEEVGVVQSRWEHLNRDYSLLTKLQALQLDVHFTVEQTGRQAGQFLLQFNGTAGIWRKQAILDAGGWSDDTLTEDLDLSYRSQLVGWKIKYLEELGSPAELPAEMNGIKSQQYRWMKGGAETARKMIPKVWSSSLSLQKKIHATIHLLSSAVFVCIFFAGVFSVPVILILEILHWDSFGFSIFFLSFLSLIFIYYVGQFREISASGHRISKYFKFAIAFPIFLALSMGLSMHNSIAVIQGFMGKKSPFIRTPKFNLRTRSDSISKSSYLSRSISVSTLFEGLLALYFLLAIVYSVSIGQTAFLFYHALLFFGFTTIFYYSVKHAHIR